MKPYIAKHLKEAGRWFLVCNDMSGETTIAYEIPTGNPVRIGPDQLRFHRFAAHNEVLLMGMPNQYWDEENSKVNLKPGYTAPKRDPVITTNELVLYDHYSQMKPPAGLEKDHFLITVMQCTPERLYMIRQEAERNRENPPQQEPTP